MPDADDFDVEYFRSLLKGKGPEQQVAAPAEPPLPAARKSAKRTAKPAAAKGTGTAKSAHGKGRNR